MTQSTQPCSVHRLETQQHHPWVLRAMRFPDIPICHRLLATVACILQTAEGSSDRPLSLRRSATSDYHVSGGRHGSARRAKLARRSGEPSQAPMRRHAAPHQCNVVQAGHTSKYVVRHKTCLLEYHPMRRRCAPEVLRSQSYNEKSDVYSFGVIMCVRPAVCLPSRVLKCSQSPQCVPLRMSMAWVVFLTCKGLLQVGACDWDGAVVRQDSNAGMLIFACSVPPHVSGQRREPCTGQHHLRRFVSCSVTD